MSFKNFSSTHNAPGKDGSADKSQQVAATGQPATQPDRKFSEVARAPEA
jgi:hypothetical protein